jgi:hypothetical protein
MLGSQKESCPGSRGPALDPDDEFGTCPVCGQRLRLGYALLLPTHERPAPRPPMTTLAPHVGPP